MKRAILAAAAAVVLAAGAVGSYSGSAKAEEFVNVLTGGTSGVYYPLGVALTKIYADKIADARTSVQSTKASVENLNLLQQGRGEVGFSLGDSVAAAWAGDEEAGFKSKLSKIRGMAAIYPNYIQIVARGDSGIKTLADLKGKRISVGAPRSGTELNARAIFKAAGMTYEDFGKVEYLPFAESVELVKNRQIDATLQSAGLGVASIRDLAATNPIVIVPIPPDVVSKVGNAVYVPESIPAGTYDGQTQDVPTAAVVNFLVTHSGVDDELVYQMTKSMYENLGVLAAAHATAKDIKREEATKGMPIPLHPGAEKYYREAGVLK
jgi:TRAP transporter TAXI family solute receptor